MSFQNIYSFIRKLLTSFNWSLLSYLTVERPFSICSPERFRVVLVTGQLLLWLKARKSLFYFNPRQTLLKKDRVLAVNGLNLDFN